MTAFADSSALVKLYVSEIGLLLVRSAGPLVISGLARVEVPAALWRKAQSGEVSINDAARLSPNLNSTTWGRPTVRRASSPF